MSTKLSSQIILLVGQSGSGKSTVALTYEQRGFVRLCADLIRGELLGDEACQDHPNMVWGEFFRRLRALLSEGRPIVVDNTNTLRRNRKAILAEAKVYNYYTRILLVECSVETAWKRQETRERKVPLQVIERQYRQLADNYPTMDEADSVMVWDNNGI